MRHIHLIAVALFLVSTSNTGCSEHDEFRAVPMTEPLKGYIALADREADHVIDEWNNSKEAADFSASWREPQRILKLEDYQRSVSMGCIQGYAPWPNTTPHRPVLHVKYELTHHLRLLGHPNHFSVWIYMDTLKIMVFGGE